MPDNIYDPTDIANGDNLTGPDWFTLQENKISDGFDIVAGAGYVDSTATGSLASHRDELDDIKGSPWDSSMNLETHDDRLDALESQALILAGDVTSHTHTVAQITDAVDLLTFQAEFDPVASTVSTHTTQIASANADILATRGSPFTQGIMNNKYLHYLVTESNSPGHTHVLSDITGSDTFVTFSDLATVTGTPFVPATMANAELAEGLYEGTSPGHAHVLADISGIGTFVTVSMLNAVKGDPWDSTKNLAAHDDRLDDIEGDGYTGGIGVDLMTHESRLDELTADFSSVLTDISELQTDLADLQGADYGNDFDRQPVNVTGVELIWPGTDSGSLVGFYNLAFTYVATNQHTLTWGGGSPTTLDDGSKVYALPDGTGKRVDARVTITELPSSTVSDTAIEVERQNVARLYDRVNDVVAEQNISAHVIGAHGDGLVGVPVVTANGVNRTITFSSVAILLDGSRVPTSGYKSGSEVLDATPSGGGSLTSAQAKVDVLSLDSDNDVVYTRGTKFRILDGVVSVTDVPTGTVAFAYVYVPGSRSYLVQSDIIEPNRIYEWMAARSRFLDAEDMWGDGADEPIGVDIESPRLIPGVTLSLRRIFRIQQPTSVTGVVLDELDDGSHRSFYGTSIPGFYDLEFTDSGQTLEWGGGAAVAVGAGGDFTLLDSSGTLGIKATVTPGSLPGGDVSDTGLGVGNRPVPGPDRYAIVWDVSATTLAFDGGDPVDVSAGGAFHLGGGDGKYVRAYVRPGQLPVEDVTDQVLVYRTTIEATAVKIEDVARQSAPALPLRYHDVVENAGVMHGYDSSSVGGSVTYPVNYDATNKRHIRGIQWSSSSGTLQEFSIVSLLQVPSDFFGFAEDIGAADAGLEVVFSSDSTVLTSCRADLEVTKNGDGSVLLSLPNLASSSTNDLGTGTLTQAQMATLGVEPGDTVAVRCRVYSKSDNDIIIHWARMIYMPWFEAAP